MPTYVALIKGAGEGCDYTIGCNLSWEIGSANDKEEFAKLVLKSYGMMDYEHENFERSIENLQIFEVNGPSLFLENLDYWYQQEFKKHQKEQEEEKERKEYERLKAKFEK